jgi:hypothetical protein
MLQVYDIELSSAGYLKSFKESSCHLSYNVVNFNFSFCLAPYRRRKTLCLWLPMFLKCQIFALERTAELQKWLAAQLYRVQHLLQ